MKEAWKLYAKSRLPSNSISDKLDLSKTRHNHVVKEEIILEQRQVAFLSPSKICKNLNFRREIQISANFAGS